MTLDRYVVRVSDGYETFATILVEARNKGELDDILDTMRYVEWNYGEASGWLEVPKNLLALTVVPLEDFAELGRRMVAEAYRARECASLEEADEADYPGGLGIAEAWNRGGSDSRWQSNLTSAGPF